MGKNICLIYPNNTSNYIANNIPIGSLQLASFLREKNIEVGFQDFNNPIKKRSKILYDIIDDYDVFGISSNVANYQASLNLARNID